MSFKASRPVFFAVLAIGGILRFWFASHYGPYELSPDGIKYAAIASNLVQKGIFSVDGVNPTAEVGPGFPLLLALNLLIAGTIAGAQQSLLVIQTLFGIVSLILVYSVGRNFYGRNVGIIAMALSAVYLPLVVIQHFTLTESLYTLLILVSVYLLSVWQPERLSVKDAGKSLSIGFFIASQALVRAPSIIFILVPLILALYSGLANRRWREPVIASLLVLSAFVGTLTPWGVRNFRTFDEVIVTSSGSIDPLLAGVYPDDSKYFVARRELDFQLESQHVLIGAASLEFSKRFVRDLIIRRFREEPIDALRWYLFGKFRLLWSLYDSGLPFARYFSAYFHKLVFVLAFLGFVIQGLYRRRQGWYLISIHLIVTSVVYQIFFATGRYSLPFVPFLTIFAAELLASGKRALSSIKYCRREFRHAVTGESAAKSYGHG